MCRQCLNFIASYQAKTVLNILNVASNRRSNLQQAPAVDLCLTVWPSRLARLGYLKRDETRSILSRCLKRDETSSISRDLTVMTVSNRLTGRFLILNGHGQKTMNRDEIKRDENGQNMFDRRCLIYNVLLNRF